MLLIADMLSIISLKFGAFLHNFDFPYKGSYNFNYFCIKPRGQILTVNHTLEILCHNDLHAINHSCKIMIE